MELISGIVTPTWMALGYVCFFLGTVYALWHMPWRWLGRAENLNRFIIVCLAIFAIWQVRAEILAGPTVHLLGATLLTLGFGWQIATLGLALVSVLSASVNGGDWSVFGLNATLFAVLGVWLSYAVAQANERFFPRHLFTYIFVAGFFGAGLTIGLVAVAAVTVIYTSQIVDPWAVTKNFLPSSVLLVFPEAFITGALITLSAVYRPDWLVSYDEKRTLG